MIPEGIFNIPGVEVANWCSFCKSRPAEGMVKFDLGPNLTVDLYICDFCVDQAKSEGFEVLTTPDA